MSDGSTIRVMTWNIHGRRGPEGRSKLARAVEILKAHNPDVLALQEIDSRGCAPDAGLPLPFLAAALGSHRAEARTIVAPDGHYGHALISRWPLTNIRNHDLSVGRHENRCAIEADIVTPHGMVNISAVHLGLWFGERRWQAREMARIAASNHKVSIMLGDFNDWPWRGPVQRALEQALPACTHHRTFPAICPIFRLDRVYCRPRGALIASWTDPAGRHVSDHLPLFADIDLSV